MGTIIDSLFTLLLGWVRTLADAVWAIFTQDRNSVLEWLGKYWIPVCAVLIAVGVIGDWLVWLIRWRPYHVFAVRARRALGIEDEPEGKAASGLKDAPEMQSGPEADPAEQWMPPEPPVFSRQEAEAMASRASQVPDAVLGEYPGMRYTETEQELSDTQRFRGTGSAASAEPETDEQRYRRELMEYEVKQAQYEQDLANWQREKAAADQRKYEEELEIYKTRRAQYALDLADYERRKAEYDRQYGKPDQATVEAVSSENEGRRKRRRAAGDTAGDME